MNELEIIKSKKESLDMLIDGYQENMQLLLDFATGYKTLKHDTLLPKHFQNDPLRLAATLKNLHIQSRELEKEKNLLNQLIKKLKKEKK